MNALVVIETLTPAVYSEPNGIDALISKLETEVRATPTDISTPAGRKAVASLAHKVARSKTALDGIGKELGAEWKAKAKLIDAERAKAWDRLEALQTEVRKPLTDWEDAETSRISGHEAALSELIALGLVGDDQTSHDIADRLNQLAAMPARDWQEFKARAEKARAETFAALTVMKEKALKREAEEAELARLRAEQVAREQRDREDRIAAEAADKARLVAEAKAAREAQEAADRATAAALKAERDFAAAAAKAEREAQEAAARATEIQRKADQERADAVARAEKAERDAEAAAAKAEQDKKDAAAKAERDRKVAAEKAEAARLAAIDAERKRVADAEAAVQAEAERRERDQQHKIKIHTDAAIALMNAGLSKDDAKRAVTAIAKSEVPNIRISY